MFIDYFIHKPQSKVDQLSTEMDTLDELKRQHQQAFKYRLKRFTVSKAGLASAFTAGAGYQALKSNENSTSVISTVGKFTWLLRLL
ncbi:MULTISPECIES: hypothetical protein [unclassified Pseudoalteromonas]|uniref:hypothetical protein n=1 Tax=unclassified Pseudoalteromonas TaxID=194690 RepID=UPI0025B31FD6|nr:MULTISPECIES: hypothetical protein [unclassified Pseudoalteromonas]MDN3379678.1 hypothetical protein [Pseudoalteromonas sp. APC 3893]MDN3388018.1 hypothetical protein [Pseudoalteromonas sp. APC 4017]